MKGKTGLTFTIPFQTSQCSICIGFICRIAGFAFERFGRSLDHGKMQVKKENKVRANRNMAYQEQVKNLEDKIEKRGKDLNAANA